VVAALADANLLPVQLDPDAIVAASRLRLTERVSRAERDRHLDAAAAYDGIVVLDDVDADSWLGVRDVFRQAVGSTFAELGQDGRVGVLSARG